MPTLDRTLRDDRRTASSLDSNSVMVPEDGEPNGDGMTLDDSDAGSQYSSNENCPKPYE